MVPERRSFIAPLGLAGAALSESYEGRPLVVVLFGGFRALRRAAGLTFSGACGTYAASGARSAGRRPSAGRFRSHRCSGRQAVDGVRASSHPVDKRRALAALARSAVLDSTPRKSSTSSSVAVLTSFVVLPQALPCQDNSCSCLISLPRSRSISPSRFSLPFLRLASLSVICLFPAHPSGQGSLRHLSTCLALAVPFTYNL